MAISIRPNGGIHPSLDGGSGGRTQRTDVQAWLDEGNLVIGDGERYVDMESGSSATPEQFLQVQEDIEADDAKPWLKDAEATGDGIERNAKSWH